MFPFVNFLMKILIIGLSSKLVYSTTDGTYCKEQHPTDGPRFTQELGLKDYVRFSHEVAILCCAEGYDTITWYRRQNDIWQRYPVPVEGDDDTPKIEEKGQILRIFDAKLTDETSYRCNVSNGTKVIQHTTELIVIECDPLARGPYPTSPFPQNQTIFEYGENITLHCTGYFGCGDAGSIQLAIWSVEHHFNQSIGEISPRYSVELFNNSKQFVKEARLHISSVQEEDTTRTFVCTLATDQLLYGQTIERVRITKKEIPKTPWLKIGLISGGCGLAVIVIIITLISVHRRHGPQIRVFINSRISFLGPKTVDRDTFTYNVFIYHALEDQETARYIQEELKILNYEVYITADIMGNENEMNIVFGVCEKSAKVMFLYSEALREDGLANFYVQSFVKARDGKDILFLVVTDYEAKDVMDWTKRANERRTAGQEGNNDSAAEENAVNENGNMENGTAKAAVENKLHRKADDLKFWEVLPRIKVPADRTNKRKKNYFLCSLQNIIPKFDDQKKQIPEVRVVRDRNSSGHKPLLGGQEENEPVSPAPRIGEELSPISDDVFDFDHADDKRLQQN